MKFFALASSVFLGASLFLFLLATDYLDGFLARKLGVPSRFGTYFDATTDFVFVFCMFAAFIPKGFCAD
jgi:phosphatidylglycerophosphate synthase